MRSIFIRNAFILTNDLFLGTVPTALLVSQIFLKQTITSVAVKVLNSFIKQWSDYIMKI